MSFRKIFIKICHFMIRSLYMIKLGPCISRLTVWIYTLYRTAPHLQSRKTLQSLHYYKQEFTNNLKRVGDIDAVSNVIRVGRATKFDAKPFNTLVTSRRPISTCWRPPIIILCTQIYYLKPCRFKRTKNSTLSGPGLREIISSHLCRWESDRIFPTRTIWTRISWTPRKSSKEGTNPLDTLLNSISNHLYRREIYHVGHWQIVQPANAEMLLQHRNSSLL